MAQSCSLHPTLRISFGNNPEICQPFLKAGRRAVGSGEHVGAAACPTPPPSWGLLRGWGCPARGHLLGLASQPCVSLGRTGLWKQQLGSAPDGCMATGPRGVSRLRVPPWETRAGLQGAAVLTQMCMG